MKWNVAGKVLKGAGESQSQNRKVKVLVKKSKMREDEEFAWKMSEKFNENKKVVL